MQTRKPTQDRSIKTRNTIVKKGFEIICKKGYYNISTKDIAEYAGVSTGIIYQYFKDKKEILLEGVKVYSQKILFPLINMDENKVIDNYDEFIKDIIEEYIKQHTLSKKAHEELMAMAHLDKEINAVFHESELIASERLVNVLRNNHIDMDNIDIKVHIVIGLIDNLCHEVTYHKHNNMNYEEMKKEVIEIIKYTLKKGRN
ncbi:MAG: TetR/AcrR family transcriptional regulator [Bacilli bacterium]|nr:TetR/AcrR family transcriptional regulator [Bacilli bacterium]